MKKLYVIVVLVFCTSVSNFCQGQTFAGFTYDSLSSGMSSPGACVLATRKVYIDRYGEIENYLLISQYREGVELGKKAEKSITENIKIGGEITISFDTMWFDDEIPKQEQPHYEIRFGGY